MWPYGAPLPAWMTRGLGVMTYFASVVSLGAAGSITRTASSSKRAQAVMLWLAEQRETLCPEEPAVCGLLYPGLCVSVYTHTHMYI